MTHGYESSAKPASELVPAAQRPPGAAMSDTDARKTAPALLDRAEVMLATYDRRGNTNAPGTYSLIRDLVAALRAEMRGWAHARGDAVDYSLRADGLEAIVRGLAGDDDDCPSTESGNCRFCRVELPAYRLNQHNPDCAWRKAREWVSAHPDISPVQAAGLSFDEAAGNLRANAEVLTRAMTEPVSGDQPDPTRAVDGERLPSEALRRMDSASTWTDIIRGSVSGDQEGTSG